MNRNEAGRDDKTVELQVLQRFQICHLDYAPPTTFASRKNRRDTSPSRPPPSQRNLNPLAETPNEAFRLHREAQLNAQPASQPAKHHEHSTFPPRQHPHHNTDNTRTQLQHHVSSQHARPPPPPQTPSTTAPLWHRPPRSPQRIPSPPASLASLIPPSRAPHECSPWPSRRSARQIIDCTAWRAGRACNRRFGSGAGKKLSREGRGDGTSSSSSSSAYGPGAAPRERGQENRAR
ncbi:uncharacterized protein IWZ02DRAFT_251424 [Phyllosticta citriasiana]|uniref:uncharacterized protein n=1 Tax=Phyllosticta citriasiana TaxID=595635 RepID=UPI0030FD30B8